MVAADIPWDDPARLCNMAYAEFPMEDWTRRGDICNERARRQMEMDKKMGPVLIFLGVLVLIQGEGGMKLLGLPLIGFGFVKGVSGSGL